MRSSNRVPDLEPRFKYPLKGAWRNTSRTKAVVAVMAIQHVKTSNAWSSFFLRRSDLDPGGGRLGKLAGPGEESDREGI